MDLDPGTISDCAIEFAVGETEVIYGSYDGEATVTTGLCEGTRRLPFALGDLVVLEQHDRNASSSEIVGLFMSGAPRISDWDLGAALGDSLAASITALVNAELDSGRADPDRVLVHNIGTGSRSLVVQVFDPGEAGPGEVSSGDFVSALKREFGEHRAAFVEALATPELGDVEVVVSDPLNPCDGNGAPILGWFSRAGDRVGFDDYFLFADNFGLRAPDREFESAFDIVPNGAVDFDDFFRFADDFGKTILNLDLFRE